MNQEMESIDLPENVRSLDRALERAAGAATAAGGADALSPDFKSRLRARIAASEAAPVPTAAPATRQARVSVVHLWAAAAAVAVIVGGGGYVASLQGPVGYIDFHGGVALSESIPVEANSAFGGGEHGLAMHLDDNRIALTVAPGAAGQVLADNRVSVETGRMWFDVVPNSGNFTVSTPAGSVEVVGTSFGVQVAADGTMEVAVSRGKVRVVSGENRILLEGGRSVAVSSAKGIGATFAQTAAPAWVEDLLQRETQSRLRLLFPSTVPVPDTQRTLEEGSQ